MSESDRNESASAVVVVEPSPADAVEQVLDSVRLPSATRAVTLPQLTTARATAFDKTSNEVTLSIGQQSLLAQRDDTLHPSVLTGAIDRGERVLVEVLGDSMTVIGAVRTQPTPGIDRNDHYAIEADTIAMSANEELALSARTASVVLRALGEVETLSDRIISRAEGVHKIIGRMLRLN